MRDLRSRVPLGGWRPCAHRVGVLASLRGYRQGPPRDAAGPSSRFVLVRPSAACVVYSGPPEAAPNFEGGELVMLEHSKLAGAAQACGAIRRIYVVVDEML